MTSSSVRIIVVSLAYVLVLIYFSLLEFPLRGDETHYWQSALHFSSSVLPSLETLRSYNDMNTPLPFYLFGQIERITRLGPQAARFLNYAMSFLIVLLVTLGKNKYSLFYGLALMLFPYFMGTAILMYTDMLCAFLVLLGIISFNRQAPLYASLFFICAISSRQYAVAFPVGILLYLLWELFSNGESNRKVLIYQVVGMIVASASILPWLILWDGVAPPAAVIAAAVDVSIFRVFPHNPLYFMACIGFYFVLPESCIDRRLNVKREQYFNSMVCMLLIGLWFLIYPPLQNTEYSVAQMGFLDKISRLIMSDPIRMIWFYILALLAALRFLKLSPVSVIFWANVILMFKSYVGWDKYILPLLVCLWYFKAVESETPITESINTLFGIGDKK